MRKRRDAPFAASREPWESAEPSQTRRRTPRFRDKRASEVPNATDARDVVVTAFASAESPFHQSLSTYHPPKPIRLCQTNPNWNFRSYFVTPIWIDSYIQNSVAEIRVRFAETHAFTLPRAAHSGESRRSLGEGGSVLAK